MPSRTRLANKTIWALQDIDALCLEARGELDTALRQAERGMNPILLRSLAHLSNHLAKIERLASEARQGRYTDAS